MFSLPVKSPLKPVPTSSKDFTRPRKIASPEVGSVILLNIFNRVDFPAPFLPTTPKTSPGLIVKETSFSAQNLLRSPLF